ncbi:hypothetical protein RIF29_14175 [Crotalaria pallida]|uniref:Uncharacterized protein n=1 Tax=Crotalaria pallida TaxID=3830 RepID=A0AAN9ICI4_CROPI
MLSWNSRIARHCCIVCVVGDFGLWASKYIVVFYLCNSLCLLIKLFSLRLVFYHLAHFSLIKLYHFHSSLVKYQYKTKLSYPSPLSATSHHHTPPPLHVASPCHALPVSTARLSLLCFIILQFNT